MKITPLAFGIKMNRFWSKVDKRGPDDCWEWTAGRFPKGYGQFKYKGNPTGAHILALVFSGIEVPDGMYVCHSCDNPPCVNPSHLFISDNAGNMKDMWNKNRGNRHGKGGVKGDRHFNAKLCSLDVERIRESLLFGAIPKDLQHIYNVSKHTISNIKRRKTWRQVA